MLSWGLFLICVPLVANHWNLETTLNKLNYCVVYVKNAWSIILNTEQLKTT